MYHVSQKWCDLANEFIGKLNRCFNYIEKLKNPQLLIVIRKSFEPLAVI